MSNIRHTYEGIDIPLEVFSYVKAGDSITFDWRISPGSDAPPKLVNFAILPVLAMP